MLRKWTGLGGETGVGTGAVTEAVALNKREYSASAQLGGKVPGGKQSPAPCHRAPAPKSTFVLKLEGEYCSDRIKEQSKSKG